jgi:hypothetical protein
MSSGSAPSPAPSGDTATGEAQRVDIGVLSADPEAFAGRDITLLARVDEVLVDDLAFVTSPSGTEEGRMLVVVAPDAPADKEMRPGAMFLLEGTVVAVTPEDLQAAGVDLDAEDLAAFDGQFAFVANAAGDPLGDS